MKTKDKIINTAIDLFNERGTNLVSTNHIALEMGISPGNLYYHFSSKNEIIRAITNQLADELLALFKIKLHNISDFSQILSVLFDSFFKIQRSYQFLFLEGAHLVKQDKELQDNYIELRGLIKAGYNELLSSMVKIKLLKKKSLEIVDELLEIQWIIMWNWASHTTLDRKIFDDKQIKKGIRLSLSIIKPQLTSIGKIAFDKTLQLI
jgi:AcrR family transcriptional regulator